MCICLRRYSALNLKECAVWALAFFGETCVFWAIRPEYAVHRANLLQPFCFLAILKGVSAADAAEMTGGLFVGNRLFTHVLFVANADRCLFLKRVSLYWLRGVGESVNVYLSEVFPEK